MIDLFYFLKFLLNKRTFMVNFYLFFLCFIYFFIIFLFLRDQEAQTYPRIRQVG